MEKCPLAAGISVALQARVPNDFLDIDRKADSEDNAVLEGVPMKAESMAQLTVRNVKSQIVQALRQMAAAHGRSAEAEHREILREALLGEEQNFRERAAALRRRLRSTIDSSEIVRADRDRDHAA